MMRASTSSPTLTPPTRTTPTPQLQHQSLPIIGNMSQQHQLATPQLQQTPQQISQQMPQQIPPQMSQQQTPQPQQTSSQTGSGSKAGTPDQFMKTLLDFMHKRGTPIASHPYVGGRVVPLPLLYAVVVKSGGSALLNSAGTAPPPQPSIKNWYTVAVSLGYNMVEIHDAAAQLAQAYQQYLGPFEEWWLSAPQHQHQLRQLQQQQLQQQKLMQNTNASAMSPQLQQMMSPLSSVKPLAGSPPPPPPPINNPGLGAGSVMSAGAVTSNLVARQQPRNRNRSRPKTTHPALRNMIPPNATPSPINAGSTATTGMPAQSRMSTQTPSPVSRPISGVPQSSPAVQQTPTTQPQTQPMLQRDVISYVPKTRRLDLHGGFNVSILAGLGDEIEAVQGDFPLLQEMGEISLHALTMSLRSLIPGELKVALDSLLLMSVEQHLFIPIADCVELLDALIDVGEHCVAHISPENDQPNTDLIEFDAYETMVGKAREEFEGFAQPLMPGSLKLHTQTMSDRISAVMTIIRNLSFHEHNVQFLAMYQPAYGFIMSMVAALVNGGVLVRNLTAVARLALVKDVLVALSNIAHEIRLRSSYDAKLLLSFVAAFTPIDGDGDGPRKITRFWPPYVPFKHRYLALAVDVLAKLVARDSPNMTLIRLELVPSTAAAAPEAARLLRSTIQLCMCTFPRLTDSQLLPRAFEVRRAVLEQSMFAAEILAKTVAKADVPLMFDAPMREALEDTMAAMDECVKPFLVRAATVLQGFVTAPPLPQQAHGRHAASAAAIAAALQHSSGDVNPFARVVRKATVVLNTLRVAMIGEDAKNVDVNLELMVLRM
ncbi:hypothetical protein V1512DRAFT_259372 [Lipomyces arxii]|uniref:uncharacterized protein n=1 Tax=Lipomyces arxii TaxID=56418 RepID=UPI0034CD592F